MSRSRTAPSDPPARRVAAIEGRSGLYFNVLREARANAQARRRSAAQAARAERRADGAGSVT